MLLTELKEVRKLDSKIGDMHRRLAELYQKRSLLLGEQPILKMQTPELTTPINEQWYRRVAKEWERYNITLPTYSSIKSKFIKAEKTLSNIYETYPEIAEHLEVIAVPPSRAIKFPVSPELRSKQKLVSLPDYAHADIQQPMHQKEWQILLAYTAEESLYGGSAKKILADKSYMLAGYDTRALGPREYTALTLQKNIVFDKNSWTVLLKGTLKNEFAPYAGYRHGRYRFDLEELDNVLDDDGFRPAIKM